MKLNSFTLLLIFILLSCDDSENFKSIKDPNIIFIVSDDQSWGDYSFMGHPHIQTPNIDKLMNEIRNMGNQISDSMFELSYVTEESNKQLSNKLSEINSSIKVGNLISTINTYQNYKINKKTKSLRS